MTHMRVLRYTCMPFGFSSAPSCLQKIMTTIFAGFPGEFVAFRLAANGLSPLHSNVDTVLHLPEPSCPTQLSLFLGMTAFYLRFLPRYSETTAPLRALLKQECLGPRRLSVLPQSAG